MPRFYFDIECDDIVRKRTLAHVLDDSAAPQYLSRLVVTIFGGGQAVGDGYSRDVYNIDQIYAETAIVTTEDVPTRKSYP